MKGILLLLEFSFRQARSPIPKISLIVPNQTYYCLPQRGFLFSLPSPICFQLHYCHSGPSSGCSCLVLLLLLFSLRWTYTHTTLVFILLWLKSCCCLLLSPTPTSLNWNDSFSLLDDQLPTGGGQITMFMLLKIYFCLKGWILSAE